MKSSFHFQNSILFKNTLLMRFLVIAMVFTLSAQFHRLHAQTLKLSIQGILKKSNGEAVPDGTYNLTFKLYTAPSGGTALWTESLSNVDVVSGIYSALLGTVTPLNLPFNTGYYLGVTVGSTEMTPRIELTSAPYAFSLIGINNQFPSLGLVIADSIKANSTIRANGILARGGAPGAFGTNKNGYAFTGGSGDKDSGLFSLGDGQVSLYANNVEEVRVTNDSIVMNGEARPQSIRLDNGGKISYNGLDDWRLVETDYFQNDVEGWLGYGPINGEHIGWSNGSNGALPALSGATNVFAGRYISENAANQVLKKKFDLTNVGPYNYIKVKFKYYFLDSWDGAVDGDMAFAAIAESITGTGMRMGYLKRRDHIGYAPDFNTDPFKDANDWGGILGNHWADHTDDGEMTFFRCTSCGSTTAFWLMFGASLDDDDFPNNANERFGVGMIEIWVK